MSNFKLIQRRSPNFDQRINDCVIDMLVLHYTGMINADMALQRLCNSDAKVSAHYFIDEKGDTNEFDFSLKAGDAIIFDEGGLHKAARSTLSERMVLRYIYSVRKRNIISDIFIRKTNKAAFGEGRPILTKGFM